MRWIALTVALAALSGPACSHDIVDVLRHSQQLRLDAMQPADDGSRADAVCRSFEQLRRALPSDVAVELFVVSRGPTAETLHGHIVVAHESLADMPEATRLFILAHELGHVVNNHWRQTGLLYLRWIPGDVTPDRTDPVANALGREVSQLAHRQEFEADGFALRMVRQFGLTTQDAVAALMQHGPTPDTATHPATRKRIAMIQAAGSPP